jgi:hypothetical protein
MDDPIPEGLTPEGGKFLCYWLLDKKENMEHYSFDHVLYEYTKYTDGDLAEKRLIVDTIGIYLWIAWKTPEYDSRKAWCTVLAAKMQAHS